MKSLVAANDEKVGESLVIWKPLSLALDTQLHTIRQHRAESVLSSPYSAAECLPGRLCGFRCGHCCSKG